MTSSDQLPTSLTAAQAAVPDTSAQKRPTPPSLTQEQVTDIGASAAQALKGVSSNLLAQVKTSQAEEFGKELSELVLAAKGLDPSSLENKGVLGRLFGFASTAKERMMSQYTTVDKHLDSLTAQLDIKAQLHRKRIDDLEALYQQNYEYHEELQLSVTQCQELLGKVTAEYETATAESSATGFDGFEAQVMADYQRLMAHLQKREDDLRRAMLLSKQMAPQIRIMQDDSRALVQKFADVKAVTLPAWRNSFSLYVLQVEQKKSVQLINDIDAATDAALKRSADLLRENTVQITTAKNRSVVTMETLAYVQTQLIGAVTDIQRIEGEAKERRKQEAVDMQRLEQELVQRFAPGDTRLPQQ